MRIIIEFDETSPVPAPMVTTPAAERRPAADLEAGAAPAERAGTPGADVAGDDLSAGPAREFEREEPTDAY